MQTISIKIDNCTKEQKDLIHQELVTRDYASVTRIKDAETYSVVTVMEITNSLPSNLAQVAAVIERARLL